ncbi:uncharacterized protein, partial [Miscanthus floridulus]|uniref:uncharacterized protein n=1 Tax=Miscanthus floridulus TaxID=154761 RepID=UPI003457A7B4
NFLFLFLHRRPLRSPRNGDGLPPPSDGTPARTGRGRSRGARRPRRPCCAAWILVPCRNSEPRPTAAALSGQPPGRRHWKIQSRDGPVALEETLHLRGSASAHQLRPGLTPPVLCPLIQARSENYTSLAEFKRVWMAKKFSYIYESRPKTNSGLFMQSLFLHCIGHLTSQSSLPQRLAGLYCLYECQPYKSQFKIYLSLEECRQLKDFVVTAKQNGLNLVPALVKRMLNKGMLLFGYMNLIDDNGDKQVEELTALQNKRVKFACDKLFANTQSESYMHMDLVKKFNAYSASSPTTRLKRESFLQMSFQESGCPYLGLGVYGLSLETVKRLKRK